MTIKNEYKDYQYVMGMAEGEGIKDG